MPVDVSLIAGNAPDSVKELVGDPHLFFSTIAGTADLEDTEVYQPIFGESIQKRMRVVDLSLEKKKEEESRIETRLVIELDVERDMLNGGGNIHGGCSAYLVDVCSSLALIAMHFASTGDVTMSVSQALNLIYHSPAVEGDKLRIVNTTLSLGTRAQSARTEIWNATHKRLVVSGTHIKMSPGSAPQAPKANL